MNDLTTRRINLSRKTAPCPRCELVCARHSTRKRRLNDRGVTGPVVLLVECSVHFCAKCKKHFSVNADHIATPHGRFTNRVVWAAVDLVIKKNMTLDRASDVMWRKYFVRIAPTTLHSWVVERLAA